MIEIGRYNTLQVLRLTPQGPRLGTEEHNILLPRRFARRNTEEGEWLEVFVYTDSEDIPVATTEKPYATVGEFACLKVVDVNQHGAFLDWGLPKDLFVPFGRQYNPLEVGQHVVVGLSLHDRTERVIGSSRLAGLFDDDVEHLKAGQPVSLLVYGFNERGAQVIVQGRHAGLIFHDRLFKRVRIGDQLDGFIEQVRDDHRLDISLQRAGQDGMDDAQRTVLHALEARDGWLALHDKSPPNAIRDSLGLSKKAFKRAVGSLYKARRITLEDGGIRLAD
ncbi:MAG: GntR family transcriptional regulator [Proteobacteria bacterium]|nr:GntR family transcriptional regulator [Pseudomonadota bacterium]MCP4916548.1 GntR family transcriptional regulator [Pseudomonadota bacterium]